MEKRIFAISILNEKISEAERHQEELEELEKHINNKNTKEEANSPVKSPQQYLQTTHWFTKEYR